MISERVTLGEIFDIARGGSPRPIDKYITTKSDGLNWIMIGDASAGEKYITTIKKKIIPEGLSKTRQVKPGDFLLTNSMSFGRPYILKTSGCIHDGWLVLSPRSKNVSPDYFYYLLGSEPLKKQFIKGASGAVVKNLNTKMVKNVAVPLPPLPEQKRIAAILDAADALRAKRRESIEQLDSLIQSTFLEIFGDPVTNPKGWEVATIDGTGSQSKVGPFGSLLHKSDYMAGGVPLINPKHVVGGKIIHGDDETVSETKANELNDYRLQFGDVLMGRRGEMGRCTTIGLEQEGWLCGTGSVFIRPNQNKVKTVYLNHLLSNDSMRRNLEGLSGGAIMPSLSGKQIKELSIQTPTLDLQTRFASIVESIEQQKTRLKSHLAELDTLFASLQSRAFNGELVA